MKIKSLQIVFFSVFFSFFYCLFIIFTSCAEEMSSKTAEQYYLDGVYYYSKRWYATAAEQFESLSKNFPYSNYTRNALILEAYTNYLDKEYDKIDGIVEVYNKLYSTDDYKDYMLFLRAMSYYSQIRDYERGSNEIAISKQLFSNLVKSYPMSKYRKNAEEKIKFLTKLQQFNELNIGDFFYKTDNFIAATRQYIGLFKKYNESMVPEFEETLLCRLVLVSKTIENDDLYQLYFGMLNKRFPDNNCLEK